MEWTTINELGYVPITTFWQDLTIAEHFGKEAIIDTVERAFNEWKNNYKYITELIMVINHKCWYYYKKDIKMSQLYQDLYYKYDFKAINLYEKNKEAIEYYFKTLD